MIVHARPAFVKEGIETFTKVYPNECTMVGGFTHSVTKEREVKTYLDSACTQETTEISTAMFDAFIMDAEFVKPPEYAGYKGMLDDNSCSHSGIIMKYYYKSGCLPAAGSSGEYFQYHTKYNKLCKSRYRDSQCKDEIGYRDELFTCNTCTYMQIQGCGSVSLVILSFVLLVFLLF